jgi:rubrerythrin
MGETSSIAEVLELAIAREIQAAQFYSEAAGRMGDPAMRAVLERLADEELGHKARLELETMKEGVVATTVGKLVDVGEPEYAEELEIGPGIDYKRVIEVAIQKERRSFRFYVRLAGIILEEELHEMLLELAEEEARHLVQFRMEYTRLVAGEK